MKYVMFLKVDSETYAFVVFVFNDNKFASSLFNIILLDMQTELILAQILSLQSVYFYFYVFHPL